MDRLSPTPRLDEPAAAWDSHRVWHDRVRQPHLGPLSTAPIRIEPTSAGWDPLETWRLRVKRPRDTRG